MYMHISGCCSVRRSNEKYKSLVNLMLILICDMGLILQHEFISQFSVCICVCVCVCACAHACMHVLARGLVRAFLSVCVELVLLCDCRVDTFIPGVETVGGYSMCSSPALLRSEGLMVLAIKFSIHPPAFWVHTKVGRPSN